MLAQFANPLNGEFDLSGLKYDYNGKTYSVNDDLRIKIGCRELKENEKKTTVWIVPKYVVDKSNSLFKKVSWSSDVGIFWAWRRNGMQYFDW